MSTEDTAPQDIPAQLAAAEKRVGLAPGVMASIMKQEIGGNTKYLDDPAAYHYEMGPDGRRVAPHTGKVSTAFGPFGILESTAKDPGYGVAPLKDKSLGEQIRFATDYAAARVKSAGSLEAGLAGYGEGAKYAAQVTGRMGKSSPVQASAPVVVAAAPAQAPVMTAPSAAEAVVQGGGSAPVMAEAPGIPAGGEGDAWQAFLKSMPRTQGQQPVNVNDLRYGGVMAGTAVPQYQFQPSKVKSVRPNFDAFSAWSGGRMVRPA